jgi:hypothetical protein
MCANGGAECGVLDKTMVLFVEIGFSFALKPKT